MNLGNFSDPNNVQSEDDFVFQLPKYKIDGKEEEFIPVTTSKYIISSTKDILYPNKNLPDIQINKGTDSDENKFMLKEGKEDGTINKHTFNSSAKTIVYEPTDSEKKVINNDDKSPVGNALNIFIKYDRVVQIYNRSSTKAEFIRDVLDMINKNSYGLFKLVLQPKEQGGTVTIVDYKFAPDSMKKMIDTKPLPYRFKPTTINSIVKKFVFNFQMDNLVAGKMFFDSAAKIRDAYKNKGVTDPNKKTNSGIPPTPYSYKSFDNSAFGNADGWYSLNNVEVKRQEKLWQKLNEKKEVKDLKNETDSKIAKEPAPDLSAILKNKSVYYNVDNKKNIRLVYTDPQLIQNKIGEENIAQKSIISPIDISLTIDGFSGFRAGQCFHIDGVPEIYNTVGMFQITNIKHNITSEDGWSTTIEASLRVGLS